MFTYISTFITSEIISSILSSGHQVWLMYTSYSPSCAYTLARNCNFPNYLFEEQHFVSYILLHTFVSCTTCTTCELWAMHLVCSAQPTHPPALSFTTNTSTVSTSVPRNHAYCAQLMTGTANPLTRKRTWHGSTTVYSRDVRALKAGLCFVDLQGLEVVCLMKGAIVTLRSARFYAYQDTVT